MAIRRHFYFGSLKLCFNELLKSISIFFFSQLLIQISLKDMTTAAWMSSQIFTKCYFGDLMCSGTCVSNWFHVILKRVQLISSKLFVVLHLAEYLGKKLVRLLLGSPGKMHMEQSFLKSVYCHWYNTLGSVYLKN